MLKLTYNHNQLSLDYLKQSLEDWINARVLVSIRSNTNIHVESNTATFLIPANSSYLTNLKNLKSDNIVEFCRCDAESVEVVLKGIWVTSELESETGVFVTKIEDEAEFLLQQLFDRKMFCHV